jgi:hypothetical protein
VATRNYAERDLKLLFGLSGMYCAFLTCNERLAALETIGDRTEVLGFVAHIVAHSDDGPRGDASFPAALRDKYDNLVLLCGHHHTLVDKQPNTYSVDDLRRWKRQTESRVSHLLAQGMHKVDFAELELVCKNMVGQGETASTALRSYNPKLKMSKNGLSDAISRRMTIGLMQAPQVANFLSSYSSQFDPTFPLRLRNGFSTKYDEFLAEGLTGDALFLALAQFASAVAPVNERDDKGFEYEAAGLAVLCHLFELCDVFEEPDDPPG